MGLLSLTNPLIYEYVLFAKRPTIIKPRTYIRKIKIHPRLMKNVHSFRTIMHGTCRELFEYTHQLPAPSYRDNQIDKQEEEEEEEEEEKEKEEEEEKEAEEEEEEEEEKSNFWGGERIKKKEAVRKLRGGGELYYSWYTIGFIYSTPRIIAQIKNFPRTSD